MEQACDAVFGEGILQGEQKSNPLTSSLDSNLRHLSIVEEENEGG